MSAPPAAARAAAGAARDPEGAPAADAGAAARQWSEAVKELEGIDGVIGELRAELRQFELRREVLAKREAALRQEVQRQVARSPRPQAPAAELPSEPLVFDLGKEESEADASTPSRRASPGGSPGARGRTGSPVGEDWEGALDKLGVAKCGVCGMKLPLDTAAIEEHCLECEAAKKEGRAPRHRTSTALGPSLRAPVDRAAKLKSRLLARSHSERPGRHGP